MSLTHLHFLEFSAVGALYGLSGQERPPHETSRPFDAQRDGMVLGEGGGMIVIERESMARARGCACPLHNHRHGCEQQSYGHGGVQQRHPGDRHPRLIPRVALWSRCCGPGGMPCHEHPPRGRGGGPCPEDVLQPLQTHRAHVIQIPDRAHAGRLGHYQPHSGNHGHEDGCFPPDPQLRTSRPGNGPEGIGADHRP